MSTPTNENRDSGRTESGPEGGARAGLSVEANALSAPSALSVPSAPTTDAESDAEAKPDTVPRHRLDLSVTKIAAGAGAAALAAAVGSKLGVAGTIVGAAVASVVSTSASTVIGHSLERGKTAARKAMPVLDPEQLETALLSRARVARAERSVRAANGVERIPMADAVPMGTDARGGDRGAACAAGAGRAGGT